MTDAEMSPVICAVRGEEDFFAAMSCPPDTVFLLSLRITEAERLISAAHTAEKRVFVHADLMEGIARDAEGLKFLKQLGADGIISTRMNIINLAADLGLKRVQRFFIADSQSVETAISSARSCNPDYVEIMPGIIPSVIGRICRRLDIPVIAGGLIETKKQVIDALSQGAAAVSTAKRELWSA